MVEISMFGSGEGPVWATGRGYSTSFVLASSDVQAGLDRSLATRYNRLCCVQRGG
jgi:hypothetical protein